MPKTSYTHMSVEERETLSLGFALGHSLRAMATVLGRAASTVSPEHRRNARAMPLEVFTQLRHHSPVALGT